VCGPSRVFLPSGRSPDAKRTPSRRQSQELSVFRFKGFGSSSGFGGGLTKIAYATEGEFESQRGGSGCYAMLALEIGEELEAAMAVCGDYGRFKALRTD
jgi:hypothetical protein